jgi:hypothetical protein
MFPFFRRTHISTLLNTHTTLHVVTADPQQRQTPLPKEVLNLLLKGGPPTQAQTQFLGSALFYITYFSFYFI